MKIRIRPFAAALALVAIATLAPSVDAQAPGIKRTLLQRTDIGDNREVILGLAEIAPGGSTGRHTHFGVETGYVIEGTSSLEIDGEAARILKAGDSYTIAAGKVHKAKAVGEAPAKVLATYVVDKGKPLATPAP
ncbi:MAG: cupin domain-containing protein [Usitatibacter sp.]